MSAEEKVIVLPSREEVLRRLKAAYDNPYLVKRFYPFIAEEAGKRFRVEGFVMMITLKIYDFGRSGFYPAELDTLLHKFVPRFIGALVDDKEAAEKAKKLYREALEG